MKSKTSAQMRRIDHQAIQGLGIPVLLLMDHAGRAVAEEARKLLGSRLSRRVIVVTGGGHNGGDGLAAARYLKGWGYDVCVFWLKDPRKWGGDAAVHVRIAQKMKIPLQPFSAIPPKQRVTQLKKAFVLIDAILGTGFEGHLRVATYDAIATMNASRRPIVAIDLPSGLDPDSGRMHDLAIKARCTITLAAPKPGLLKPSARRWVGRLIIADIGIPTSLL